MERESKWADLESVLRGHPTGFYNIAQLYVLPYDYEGAK